MTASDTANATRCDRPRPRCPLPKVLLHGDLSEPERGINTTGHRTPLELVVSVTDIPSGWPPIHCGLSLEATHRVDSPSRCHQGTHGAATGLRSPGRLGGGRRGAAVALLPEERGRAAPRASAPSQGRGSVARACPYCTEESET